MMLLRGTLLGTTYLRSPDDVAGAGAAAPVVVAEPAAVAEPAPIVAPEPVVVDPEPVVEAPAAEAVAGPAKPDAHATETLLEAAGKPDVVVDPAKAAADPAKVEALVVAAEAPKVDKDGKPIVEAAPAVEVVAPVYDFKLPEGLTADPAALTQYTDVLKQHNISPEVGQALIDQHTSVMAAYAKSLQDEQHSAFEKTRQGWRDEVMADAEIGGAGHKTALTKIAAMRDMLVQEKDRPAFDNFLRVTGAGDHPMFLKILHTAHRWLGEPTPPAITGTPAKTNGQAPGRGRGLRGMYSDNRATRGTP